jgi:hypothetical protein
VPQDSGAPARAFNGTLVTPPRFLLDGDGCMVRTGAGITDLADPQRRIEVRLGG